MDLDSGVEIRSQPNTDPVILDNVRDIIFIKIREDKNFYFQLSTLDIGNGHTNKISDLPIGCCW